ncbi:right-handed parallel beta-helix repeat-containing protein [Kineococcus esterisolvens]|uniref:hypothetical protein n=1 Tax=unclassified Kineococcus TaxID=2621656 RepID=UPI003D7DA4A9
MVALVAVLVAGAAHALVAAEPRARRVECGEEITGDVRLTADLRCPGPSGLVVAADGVEVDLDGHAITGPGLVAGRSTPSQGISVEAHDATIRGGRITGWDVGVRVGWGRSPRSAALADVRLEADGVGASVGDGSSLFVTTSLLRGNNTGITAQGQLVVDRSRVEENFTGVAVQSGEPGGPFTLRGSLVQRNNFGLMCHRPGFLVERSTFAHNDTALIASDCRPSAVLGSAFLRNGDHLWLDEPGSVTVACTLLTRSGGPEEVAVQPCGSWPGPPPGTGRPLPLR